MKAKKCNPIVENPDEEKVTVASPEESKYKPMVDDKVLNIQDQKKRNQPEVVTMTQTDIVEQEQEPALSKSHASKDLFSLNNNNEHSQYHVNLPPQEPVVRYSQVPNLETFVPANEYATAEPTYGSLQLRQDKMGLTSFRAFKESDLLKAANVYQQFDKKGNIFENRLYAKTSINQAKL